ncbi:MAG: extracellular solute-binding protein, partial [Spirochaetales bacterium]|nr:extracellular solute-binding protein [Spirochaetales bacterium]
MNRALISLVLLLAGGAFLFAAGGQEAAEPAATAAAEKTPIEQYNPGFAFPTEKVEIAYWHVLETRPGFDALAKEIARDYSAIHPNVSITVRDIPNAQQRAIFSAAFESRSAGDIVWVEAQVGLMAKALLPAPDWAAKYMEDLFTPYVLSLSKVKGEYYGWSGAEVDAGQMLYYRKDLFREVGLDPDDPPEFMPELLEAAQKLTKWEGGQMSQAGIAVRYAGGHQGIGDKFSKYAAAFVDTSKRFYYNEDYTDVIFDDPGWIEAAQFFH